MASAMWYNEYNTIINAGINPDELTTFFFNDYGLNFPEDGIYVLEETYDKNPGFCTDFVTASIRGWEYAFDHPEEALDIIMKQLMDAHIPATRVHQQWMLKRIQDLMIPGGKSTRIGQLQADDYYRVAQALKDYGMIGDVPKFSEFHREVIRYEK